MTTFADLLARRLRADPGRPLVTFEDHATGERTELSVTTYANWVAKTASLLVDELGLERGDRLRLDLPLHWLGPVFLGAAWTAGLVVSDADDPDAVVTGPAGLDRWAARAGDLAVIACALLPMAVRFPEPVPPGVHDFGVEVWGQPDAFVPWDPPDGTDPAVDWATDRAVGPDGRATHDELWGAAAAGTLLTDGGRLLSEANPASPSGLASFTEPLARSGSVVLVAHADPGRIDSTAASERVTARFPGPS